MKRTDYDQVLDGLAEKLRTAPMTAREISTDLKCCRPAAYQRIRALQARGYEVYTLTPKTTPGRPGPKAVAYGVRA